MQKIELDGHSVKMAEPAVERWVFSHRLISLVIFPSITVFLTYMASKLEPDASLETMIPLEHPYVQNFL